MELNLVEIVSLVAGVIGIVGFVWQVFSKKNENRRKKEEWVKDVCTSVSEVSQGMGIGQLDSLLSNIYDLVNGKEGLEGNPNLNLISNDQYINKALTKIEILLNNSPVSKSIIESFQGQLKDLLNQYQICRNDLGVIVDLCEAKDFDEVKAIVERKDTHISEDLRGAIASAGSAHGDSIPFDRTGFISDMIGIRFVDSQIPDYSEMINQLMSRLQETVSSNAVSLSLDADRRYDHHGSSDALFEKAEEYYARKKYKEAFEWYTKAAAQDMGEAYFRLAECFEKGEGCTKDPMKAADYYSLATKKGLAISEYRLGLCYEYGIGRAPDFPHAISYYDSSAKKGYAEAQYRMGLCYWHGWSRNENKDESCRLIKEAAEKGCVDAQRCFSAICYLKGELEESLRWARVAADNGDVDAMGYYGYLLMAKGVEKSDYMPWLTKSAEGGNVYSQFNLGIFYLGKKNLGLYCAGLADECPETEQSSEAQRWFEMAAVSGDPASQYILGMFYLRKNRNRNEAESLFDKALGQGFKWANFGLGIIKFHIAHNSEAREHLENAWIEGNPYAGNYLKQMYRSGFGVIMDNEHAYYYESSAVKLACEWFLSKTDKQLSALKQSYVPPFDRQFYDDPDSDSTCQKVIDSTLMEYIRRY